MNNDENSVCQEPLQLYEILYYGPEEYYPGNSLVYICETCGHRMPCGAGNTSGTLKFEPHKRGDDRGKP
jgi:hypothetical protein